MADSTDTYDLTQLAVGGTVREDVMAQIFDISKIPLPFTSRVGTSSHKAPLFEWPVDRLAAPNTANAVIDGSIGRAATRVETTSRIGNNSQISTKTVKVSTRANEVDTLAYTRELATQLASRGNELRRDVEAMALLNNANVIDTGDSGAAGETAGLEAWLDDEDELGATIYDSTAGNPSSYRDQSDGITSIGGWTNQSGGIIPAVVYTAMATPAAITEVAIKDVVERLYMNGADPTVLMARPSVIRRISEFMFTSAARIATITNQGDDGSAQRTASGSVNVMVTDFSVLELVPNRLQPASGDGTPVGDTAFIFDPNFLSLSYLHGYRSYPLAKTGLMEEREIAVDWGLRVNAWTALGGIVGILNSAAMTAS